MSGRIATALLLCCLVIAPRWATVCAQLDLGINLKQSTPAVVDPVRVTAAVEPGMPDSVIVAVRFSMPPGVHVYAAESLFFRLSVTGSEGLGETVVHLAQLSTHKNFDGTIVPVFKNNSVHYFRQALAGAPWRLSGSVTYQACDDSMCFIPRTRVFALSADTPSVEALEQTRVAQVADVRDLDELLGSYEIAGSIAGFQNAERFSAFLRDPGTDAQWSLEGKSWWLVVALVIAGGFLLNLTPCVLPMLPITLSVIGAGSQAGSKRKGLFLGSVYAAGMTVAYGAAGAAVIISGATFGAVNASPIFNIGVAALFVLLALAMFDVLHIDFTRFRGAIKPGALHGGTVAGVFALGGLTAILAGACVAPVVISVVVYATALYSGGQTSAILLPFLLGAGMALPWPLAGAGLTFLPKPGAWMVWVRNIFGIAILVIAGWYGYTGIRMVQAKAVASVAAVYPAVARDSGWMHSLEGALEKGLIVKKPVLVDFWATWCKNCHAMDAGPMRDEKVVRELEKFVLVKYQAEDPESEPARSVLQKLNVIGLPTYIVLRPVAQSR